MPRRPISSGGSQRLPASAYLSIFESAPNPYLVLDTDLFIVEVNSAYLDATMTEREEIVGRHLFDVFPDNPDDSEANGTRNLGASLERAMASRRPDVMALQKYDIRRPAEAGGGFEERYWSPINTPVLDEQGDVRYLVHHVEDVTAYLKLVRNAGKQHHLTREAEKRAERIEAQLFATSSELARERERLEAEVLERKRISDELLEARAELERKVAERTADLKTLNEELESFNYSVSHDLRAPLRAVDGFSELLLEEYGADLDENGRHYVRRIKQGVEGMKELIDALLGLSQLTMAPLERTELDISRMARSIVDCYVERDPEREVDLVIHEGMKAWGDERLVAALLENLISNSWKYTGERERARIEIGCEEDDGPFYVRDNGAGFDVSKKDRIFEPFGRLHPADRFEGIGIGLATVKRIVSRHQGDVWVESVEGEGTTVHFSLSGSRCEVNRGQSSAS